MKKFEHWDIAGMSILVILFLFLGFYLGFVAKGGEVKNDFITCGLGAACPRTHTSEYIGWECIKCSFNDEKKDFNFSLGDICKEYEQDVVSRFDSLKDTAVKMAETRGENCSNISWQECLYNKGKGVTYENFVYGNNSKDMYCYTIPSPPKCDYIELKNGTLIPKGSCIMTFNYIMKCINKSEIKGMITK